MRTFRFLAGASLAALTILGAAACSDSNGTATATTPSNPTAASPTTPATSGGGATAGSAGSPTTATTDSPAQKKVSANNATRTQLAAAFEAAGIPNAANWAKEVEEYRPYPANDPTMARLRQNLAKYNPPAGLVDQLIAVLALDQ